MRGVEKVLNRRCTDGDGEYRGRLIVGIGDSGIRHRHPIRELIDPVRGRDKKGRVAREAEERVSPGGSAWATTSEIGGRPPVRPIGRSGR